MSQAVNCISPSSSPSHPRDLSHHHFQLSVHYEFMDYFRQKFVEMWKCATTYALKISIFPFFLVRKKVREEISLRLMFSLYAVHLYSNKRGCKASASCTLNSDSRYLTREVSFLSCVCFLLANLQIISIAEHCA